MNLEQEKEQHEWKANVRTNLFKTILTDSPIALDWLECVSYIVGTIIMSVVATAPISLIAAHNVFSHPDYWYEILVPFLGTA